MEFGSKFTYAKTRGSDSGAESEEEVVVREDDDAVLSESSGDDDDGETCMLDIFDTAGQEEYSAMREQYTRSGDLGFKFKFNGFVIVYSVIDPTSFQKAESLFTWLKRFKEEGELHAVLVGNKIDLTAERQIPREDGENLAAKLGIPYFETSAKTGKNVVRVYQGLMKTIPRSGSNYNVVMLGCGGVGKSSLTIRFTQDMFVNCYPPTIEEWYSKMILVQGQPNSKKLTKEERKKKKKGWKPGAASSSGGARRKMRNARQVPPPPGARPTSANYAAPPPPPPDRSGGGIFSSLKRVFSGKQRHSPPPSSALPSAAPPLPRNVLPPQDRYSGGDSDEECACFHSKH